MSKPDKPTILPYADLPARYGITSDRHGAELRIIIPRPVWWRRPGLLSIVLVLLWATVPLLYAPSLRWNEAFPFLITPLVVGVAAISYLFRNRPAVIHLTLDELILENITPVMPGQSPERHRLSYSRREIYDTRFVRHSGNLVVRMHGVEMLEIRPSEDPDIVEWIAAELRAALGLPNE